MRPGLVTLQGAGLQVNEVKSGYTTRSPVSRVNVREVELEVELPGGGPRGVVPVLVHEAEAQLDDLQQVHVAAQQLVLVVHRAAELPDGPHHHARELRVLETGGGRAGGRMSGRDLLNMVGTHSTR